ncbi:G-rich sequence factor 1 [Gouania willdenowi]|uniref:Heterogeneous nuclear ribonucleoprotein H-like n=1 Tax=Gouania willdenowi TaxID=441366 RepID=A0A8C5D9L9_GOUWI|nr:heterogeneous nuclear ribonucleoprotein H-like [Gouania willdenowi]
MSRPTRSLFTLLQRCVTIRKSTLLTSNTTRSIVRSWSSLSGTRCLFHPAVGGSQRGLCTKTGAPSENDYPPLPAYDSVPEPQTKEVYIVHLKGLAWSCTVQDIEQFFSDCRIRDGVKGIHMTVDRLGRPSGEAFLELEHEVDVSKALEKHRQYLGPRYVEVSEVTNIDAEAILKRDMEQQANDGVVRLRGIPFSSTEDDIIDFFSGLDIAENGIVMVTNAKGRKSGEAYVQFSSQEAADKALLRDRELIGSRYIEVFPSRQREVEAFLRTRTHSDYSERVFQTSSGSQMHHQTVSHQSSAVPQHYIHMRGLPFHVSGEEIAKFFFPLVISKILIEYGPNGRPKGEADVFFRSHQDALAAMSRDRMNIGQRYIELFLNSEPENN